MAKQNTCTFTLEQGTLDVSWPNRMTQSEYDMAIELFTLLQRRMERDIVETTQPAADGGS